MAAQRPGLWFHFLSGKVLFEKGDPAVWPPPLTPLMVPSHRTPPLAKVWEEKGGPASLRTHRPLVRQEVCLDFGVRAECQAGQNPWAAASSCWEGGSAARSVGGQGGGAGDFERTQSPGCRVRTEWRG